MKGGKTVSPEKQIKAMAELEGVWRNRIPVIEAVYGGPDRVRGHRESSVDEVPDYIHDCNAVRRVVNSLEYDRQLVYVLALSRVVLGMDDLLWGNDEVRELLLATAAQQTQACLMACGKWEV